MMRMMAWDRIVAAGMAAAIILSAVPARAEPIEDFYRGKTLRMLIGYGPGGGYDIYGRLVAEVLPRHVPGKPTIIAPDQPGAGSLPAARFIYVRSAQGRDAVGRR